MLRSSRRKNIYASMYEGFDISEGLVMHLELQIVFGVSLDVWDDVIKVLNNRTFFSIRNSVHVAVEQWNVQAMMLPNRRVV
jgi:hypothetical protein